MLYINTEYGDIFCLGLERQMLILILILINQIFTSCSTLKIVMVKNTMVLGKIHGFISTYTQKNIYIPTLMSLKKIYYSSTMIQWWDLMAKPWYFNIIRYWLPYAMVKLCLSMLCSYSIAIYMNINNLNMIPLRIKIVLWQ